MQLLRISGIALIIAIAQPAQAQPAHGSANENTEVLIGGYYCGNSSSSAEAWVYYSFDTSGDIFDQGPYLYRRYTDATSTPEFCDSLAAASVELLTQSGCTTGPIDAFNDDTGWSRSFQFVCHARRSAIVAIIAGISEQIMTASPP